MSGAGHRTQRASSEYAGTGRDVRSRGDEVLIGVVKSGGHHAHQIRIAEEGAIGATHLAALDFPEPPTARAESRQSVQCIINEPEPDIRRRAR